MASAWLIQRFIDPKATFAFATQPAPSDIPFDMYEGDFSHQGPLCTFETLASRFGLTAPAVVRIGQIVHDLDMKEARFARPEGPALDRLVQGLQRLYSDDEALMNQGIVLFEALARSFESTEGQDASGRARGRTLRRDVKRAGLRMRGRPSTKRIR